MLLHQIFEEQALKHPERPAVEWQDTTITYGELNRSANELAAYIKHAGDFESGMVALSLHKGPLIPVAVLAVLKAGLAWVPLPHDAPRLRIQKILQISKPDLVLACQDTLHVTDGLCTNLVLDDLETRREIQQQPSTNPPVTEDSVCPDDLCHVLFTSGSTGVPKGVMIEHKAVAHNARILADLFALDRHTRTLQFAAYTFDVFGLDLFMTFHAGGCLVMGSLSDMMTDLTAFMNHTRINYAHLTPTVIALVDPTSVPSLRTLASSGEPLTAEILRRWRHRVRLINAYGPTETIVCTAQDMSAAEMTEPQSIGTALEGSEVVLMRKGCAEEAPPGTVGEICVGGIQLFRSYLGVGQSESQFSFRDGRRKLYRTGDLGMLTQLSDSNQTIRCLGRQDGQVKVHGVRLDLGDVERAVRTYAVSRNCVALVANSGPSQGRLSAAVAVGHAEEDWRQIATTVPEMNVLHAIGSVGRGVFRNLVAWTEDILPSQAVPSSWWIVDRLPLTVSGKLDRMSVRRWLETMTKEEHAQLAQPWVAEKDDPAPSDGAAAFRQQLVDLCSRVLGIGAAATDTQMPLLQSGFDSLDIIRLVSLARKEKIDMTVQQVLREGSIAQLSVFLSGARPNTKHAGELVDQQPFSLAPEDMELQHLKLSVAEQCHVAPEDILDVYPCTPLQSGMMALAARRSDAYVCDMSFLLSPKVEINRFKDAWEQVQFGIPIFRNRIVHEPRAGGLLQATLRYHPTSISDDAFHAPMSFGDSLCRGRVIWDDATQEWKFLLKIHHSLFDGWTKELMLLELKRTYDSGNVSASAAAAFRTFVGYLVEDTNRNEKQHFRFWRDYLDGCDVTDFPRVALKWTGELASHHGLTRDMNADVPSIARKHQVTVTSVVQAAWAVVLGKHTSTQDVVFGTTLSGRNVPVEDVAHVIGPTMTTVPCRARWDRSTTLGSLLQQLHRHSIEMIPHQHYGLQSIANIGKDTKNACSFRSLLVVQPEDTAADSLGDFVREEEYFSSDMLRTYPITIEFIPSGPGKVKVKAHYDENIIPNETLLCVLDHFESTLHSLGSVGPHGPVVDIEVMGKAEVERVLAFSSDCPQKVDRCLHELVQEAASKFPDHVAILQYSPPKTLSYRSLDQSSTRLARHLQLSHDVGTGDVVPLSLEKSALAVTAMLAVLKTGAAYVALDASQPVQRLQQLAQLLKSKIALCSPKTTLVMRQVVHQALELTDDWLAETGPDPHAVFPGKGRSVSPNDLAVVFFTSGSTGQPKGVASKHSAVSTAMSHFARMLGITPGLRVFQFTAFTFDMGLKDIYCTLLAGGCLCLPDEPDRLNPEAMRHMDVNVAFLTPSVAEVMDPEDVPSLQILNLGGERATASVMRKWAGRVRLINSYGPTETVACLTAADRLREDASPDHIGKAVTGQLWIVQRDSTESIVLAPIGSIGEIAISGFTVAEGYLNDAVRSGEAFVGPPRWMRPEAVGSRLYLTGDLGIREPDGCVRYVGRNDRQVKIHGVRIEPAEAEHHLRQMGGIFSSAVVDSAHSTDAKSSLALVAFVLVHGGQADSIIADLDSVPEHLHTECRNVQRRLAEKVPGHLIPRLFIPVHHFPLSASGKTDRKRLRAALETDANRDDYVTMNSTRDAPERSPPQTEPELRLRDAWKEVLAAERSFGLNDDFFKVGGDSFAAIRLVLVCRKRGLKLSVADVYDRPTLGEMAAVAVQPSGADRAEDPAPLSLLAGDVGALLAELAQICHVDVQEVEDVYPASPFQEGLAAINLHTGSAYMARWTYSLSASTDLDRLRRAMEVVIARNPIFRTTLAHVSCGTVQVVLRYGEGSSEQHLETARIEGNMLFGYSLSRSDKGNAHLGIDIHHVLYDEWTIGFLLDDLTYNYANPGSERPGRPTYGNFIRHLANADDQASSAFWRHDLEHASTLDFPHLPRGGRLPQTNAAVLSSDPISLQQSKHSAITPAAVATAALAILLSSYANVEDVTFGVTLSGRHVPGLEDVAGPMISTVPLRLKTGGGQAVGGFLTLVQSKMRALQDHQHFGLRRIAGLGGDGPRKACAFRTLLVIQQEATQTRALGLVPVDEETHMSLNYGLVVLVTADQEAGAAKIRIEYDSECLLEHNAHQLLRQLAGITEQLSSVEGAIGSIDVGHGEGGQETLQTDSADFQEIDSDKTAPRTSAQRQLQRLWADAMDMAPDSIGLGDSIHRLGGDSMTLIKLLYVARKKGLRLVIGGKVNQLTTLADMSQALEEDVTEPDAPAAFSLAKGMSQQECIKDAAAKCDVDPACVEDVYPCTPLQEGLVALGSKEAGSYIAQSCFEIGGPGVDAARLRSAVGRVWHAEPILRTRIFVGAKLAILQAVLRDERLPFTVHRQGQTLQEYLAQDRQVRFEAGQPLSRFALVYDGQGRAYLVVSQHHAVSDGWTTNLLIDAIRRAYGPNEERPRPANRMASFVQFVHGVQHSSDAAHFWKKALAGASATEFPHSKKRDFRAAAWAGTSCGTHAAPALLEAAWGIVLGRYADSEDVCFGVVRSGRTAPVAGVESLMGPAIVTIPRRLRPQTALGVSQYLEQVCSQAAQALPFEQFGLQNMRALGEDARRACEFRTLLVIQPEQPDLRDAPVGLALEHVDAESMVGTYALSIYCLPGGDGSLTIRINYDDAVVSDGEVQWISYHFVQVVGQLTDRPDGLVADIDLCGDEDRRKVAAWNAEAIKPTQQRVEEVFQQRLPQWAGLVAVSAHDRPLTYAELDSAARSIAGLLVQHGAGPGDLVLVCMEKSALMVASLLGVFKAGAGYIPLAIDNPTDRLQSILNHASARLLICSPRQQELCRTLASAEVVVLDWESLSAQEELNTESAQPHDLAYVMYTSGSTGIPKGVMLSHTAVSTTLLAQGARLGYQPGTRTLQFCSYAFDCSVTEIFMTLLHGGRLCVPAEEQRLTSLADFINTERVDMAVLTATVVGGMLQHPDHVPSLSTLMLVGEAMTQAIVDNWSSRVRVINDYGPTEACIDAVINVDVGRETQPGNIGHPIAAHAWVVDRHDRSRLAPIGCPGELLLSGPTLAAGYAGDKARTDAAFLPATRFAWAHADDDRLYATGDVARQQPDGSIVFIARNDTQVKLRGLRVELGEIEFFLEKADGIAAAVADVVPDRTTGEATLVAFVAAETRQASRAALDALRAVLPRYMVPQAVLPLARIALTASGKTDRSALRRLYETAAHADLVAASPSPPVKRPPVNERQATLRRLWADVLRVDAGTIGLDDDFVMLGGNSISAIQLSSHAHGEGVSLPARSIFQNPVLEKMALQTRRQSPVLQHGLPWTATSTESYRAQISAAYPIAAAEIEAVYPCTPLQSGLIALTMRQPRAYVATETFRLAPSTDLARLKMAWDAVYRRHEMLRTRLCQVHDDQGHAQLVQVVCSGHGVPWRAPPTENMGLGTALARFSLLRAGRGHCLQLTRHHAIYDGWSTRLLFADLGRAYADGGRDPPPRPPFRSYVEHLLGLDRSAAAQFWARELAGFGGDHYPPGPPEQQPEATSTAEPVTARAAGRDKPAPSPLTFSTTARAAWALVLATRGRRSPHDICFGAVVSGRMEPVAGIEAIAGPTLATVPVRVRVDAAEPAARFLERVGRRALDAAPFEQLGLGAIADVSRDARKACGFGNLLVVQPPESQGLAEETLCRRADSGDVSMLQLYGVVVECRELADGGGFRLEASFDERVTAREEMRGLLRLFSRTMTLLLEPGRAQSTVGALMRALATVDDHGRMLSFNQPAPPPLPPTCLHGLVQRSARLHPHRVAVLARDRALTYAELDGVSSRLAARLRRRFGIGAETLVPLCFEKSSCMIVAMLAVLKAGAGYVPLDPEHPGARLRQIADQTGAGLVLVSAAQERRVVDGVGASTVFVVDAAGLGACPESAEGEARAGPQNVAYVMFTSGSTGRPKGVVMEHGSVSHSMMQYGRVFGYRRERAFRTLQLSPYTFDVSVAEIFATLAFGGAVCVPTEEERLSDLPGTIASMRVDVAFVTPTMAATMHPDDVPTLELLCLTGEARPPALAPLWMSRAAADSTQRRLFDAYGPTEAAVHCCAAEIGHDTAPNNIGSPFGGQLWIVDADDHTRLLPVGCVGELVISGATLARGYLRDAKETSKAFVEHVSWFEGTESRRIYKTGDLARFACDGTIEFMGRKNSRQIKLHGLRIELGDIEAALQACEGPLTNVVAEVVSIAGNDSLVAFVQTPETASMADASTPIVEKLTPALDSLVRETAVSLRALLPAYMVPPLLLLVSTWPRTASGKTDRQLLRNMAGELTSKHLDVYQAASNVELRKAASVAVERTEETQESKTKSPTDVQNRVIEIWRRTLRRDSSFQPVAEDDFFAVGGDSVSAIFLVAEFRRENVHVTVSDIHRHRHLGDMVGLLLSSQQNGHGDEPAPFSLLRSAGAQVHHLRRAAAAELGVSSDSIEDMYPCTHLQEGIVFLSERVAGSYHGRFRLLMPRELEVDRIYLAFHRLIEIHGILRTRIVFDKELGSVQVVLSPAAHFQAVRRWGEGEKTTRFGYGSPLYRHQLTAQDDRIYLELECHHSVYDGWSLPLMAEDLRSLYRDVDFFPKLAVPFKNMVAYAFNPSVVRAGEEFWDSYLDGAAISDFPEVAGHANHPICATAYHERAVSAVKQASPSITMATILTAAWSLVISKHTGTNDVCFGLLLSGRNAPVSGIEEIRGPTINTIPFRLVLAPTTSAVLDDVQAHMVNIIPHQFTSLAKLRKAFSGGRQDFGSLLAIQSERSMREEAGGGQDFDISSVPSEQGQVAAIYGEPYPLFLEVTVDGTGNDVLLAAQFDPKVLSIAQLGRILGQYEIAIRLLAKANAELGPTPLAEVTLLSNADEQCLRDWAGEPIQPGEACVHEMIEQFAAASPEQQAIEHFGERVTYAQLDQRANSLACHLLGLGIHAGPTAIVPVWMETSPAAVVALLAILKLGASYVPLDHRLPIARAKYIVDDVAANMILCSEHKASSADEVVRQIADRNVTMVDVDKAVSEMALTEGPRTQLIPPRLLARPTDLAYVIYTSGSTGQPKGVMMEHWALTATVKAQAATYGFDARTRMFGLASLSWDPSLLEIFATLSHGGCLCMPTPRERSQDLVGAINRLRADQISTSPAVAAALIDLRATPTVRVMALGGEVMRRENIRNAAAAGVRLFNVYGPSEACVDAIVHRGVVSGADPLNIGTPMSSQVWIVDPGSPRRLVPPGCVGEIALSGTLARGYLNDAAGTARAFVTGCPYASPVYLTGDLGRHLADGSVYFLGRKDRQVKLNGQRVELGEIEDAVRTLWPGREVVVDYFSSGGDAGKQLVVFSSSSSSSKREAMVEVESRLRTESPEFQLVQTTLRDKLPRYMIPRVFVTVPQLPLSNADKVDLQALRAAYTKWEGRAAERNVKSSSPPPPASTASLTKAAVVLRQLWASAIGCPADSIQAHDDFFDLGADSLTIVKLATLARTERISISVADVYGSPTLLQMARLVDRGTLPDDGDPEFPPRFSLLPDSIRTRLEDEEEEMESPNGVVDAYPCTMIQTASLIQGQKRHKAHYAWFLIHITGTMDMQRLREACGLLAARHDALRTTFRIVNGHFIQQVHRRPQTDFRRLDPCDSVRAFCSLLDRDVPDPVRFSQVLARYRAAEYAGGEGCLLAIGMSHAQYDGFCWSTILNDLQQAALDNSPAAPSPPFSCFISHTLRTTQDPRTESFWTSLLRGSSMTSFTASPQQTHLRRVLSSKHVLTLPPYTTHRPSNATFAMVVKAAWALVLSHLSGATDVVFGSLVFGRDPAIAGVGAMVGACMNVVPTRISLGREGPQTVADLLERVRRQQVATAPFETTALPAVCACAGWPPSSRFGSIVQHQNIDETVFGGGDGGDDDGAGRWTYLGNAAYPGVCDDVLDCWITTVPLPGGTRLEFAYSTAAIPDGDAAAIARLLCDTVSTIYEEPGKRLGELQYLQLAEPFVWTPRSCLDGGDADGARGERADGVVDGERHAHIAARLRELWGEVLQPPRERAVASSSCCGVKDDAEVDDASFFALGGDSRCAVQLSAACERDGLELGVQDVFDYPTRKLQTARLSTYGNQSEIEAKAQLVFEPKY